MPEQPELPDPAFEPAPCPRCPGSQLARVEDRKTRFLACPECRGLFVRRADLEVYLGRKGRAPEVARAGRDLLERAIAADTPGISHRDCPACRGPLERFGVGESPLVVADRCPAHGVWLDPHDLPRLLRAARAHAAVQGWIEAFPDPGRDEIGFPEAIVPPGGGPMVCPNCRRRFAEGAARCGPCGVLLYDERRGQG